MNFLKKNFTRGYIKVLLYILVMAWLTIILLSSLLYNNFEKTGLRLVYDFNKKNLSSISQNIEYMDEMVTNFCLVQFSDANNSQIMFNSDDDLYSIEMKINNLKKIVDSNIMIHSVTFYNNARDEFYSTFKEGMFTADEKVESMLREEKTVPILTPIPRIIENIDESIGSRNVFTYFMYETLGKNGRPSGALVVNIKADWLMKKIEKYYNPNSRLMIADDEGRVIIDSTGRLSMSQPLEYEYWKKIAADKGGGNSIVEYVNGEKRVITYFYLPEHQWILISDERYDTVFSDLESIKNQTILYTMSFLLIIILVCFLLSKRIYSPILKLVNTVRGSIGDKTSEKGDKDDLEYLSKAFTSNISKLEEYQNYKKSTNSIIKENVWRKILSDSNFDLPDDFINNFDLYNKSLNEGDEIFLILFTVDQYAGLLSGKAEKQDQLIDPILIEIKRFTDKITEKNEVLHVEGEEIVLLLNADFIADPAEAQNTIRMTVAGIQETVIRNLSISMSAFISRRMKEIGEVSEQYMAVRELRSYKMIYGARCIVDGTAVPEKDKGETFVYPFAAEERLLSELKNCNLEAIHAELDKFIATATKNNMKFLGLSLIKLVLGIEQVYDLVNINEVEKEKVDFSLLITQLMNAEDIGEVKSRFNDLFIIIINLLQNRREDKHNILINSIIEYIRIEYKNKSLCLKEIAGEFRMSPVYIGKIFRESVRMSVGQYINKVRMDEALNLLENTDFSICEIFEKVGVDNESNFYKLFKNRFGITPNTYRMNRVIKNKLDKPQDS